MVRKKSKEKKGKRPHRNKPTGKKYLKFKFEENKILRGKNCPRCGPGVFVAVNQGRIHCGRCHYTEFEKATA